MSWILYTILISILAADVSLSPKNRIRRQSHVDFKQHFFPFKELCAERLHLPVESIVEAAASGFPSAYYCAEFVLQCVTKTSITRHLQQCGVGMWWSFKIDTCQVPSLAERPECVAAVCPYSLTPLTVADSRACYGYYECIRDSVTYEFCEEGGYNATTKNCAVSDSCEGLVPKTGPNGAPCTEADMPKVCTTPGYLPNMAYCGCMHENWELKKR